MSNLAVITVYERVRISVISQCQVALALPPTTQSEQNNTGSLTKSEQPSTTFFIVN